jgi:cell division protein FtsW
VWGVSASVLLPLFINLGGVLKLMPLTGIPLPFISYGGSSLLFMWVRVGLIMRVCKEAALS